MENKGFTLIELLVVIAIIGILAGILFISIDIGTQTAKARDAIRANDISLLDKQLQLYFLDNGNYPSTGSINNVYMDPNCVVANGSGDLITEDWIPDFEDYVSELPQDPVGLNTARPAANTTSCYMYSSDGSDYLLSAWGTAEEGPQDSLLYSRAGFRESGWNRNQALYLCNHAAIGSEAVGDYYKFSYTKTNLDCTW